MPKPYTSLKFHPLTIEQKESIQAITLHSGRRNCNFNFTNLIGWQFLFDTTVCLLPDIAIFKYNFDHRQPAYFISSKALPDISIIEALLRNCEENGETLVLIAVEDDWASQLKGIYGDAVNIEPIRNSYDYIYLRKELEHVKGKNLKAKRNHINKFLSLHPDYKFIELTPDLFHLCRQLEQQWREDVHHDNPWYGNTIESEQKMIETIFNNWSKLDIYGGAIFVEDKMIAFSFGSAVTCDTFDTCVEKADRNVDGAFNIINQQMAAHLPSNIKYINREEDMGLEGLRKSKLSYHPETLLSYNILTFEKI